MGSAGSSIPKYATEKAEGGGRGRGPDRQVLEVAGWHVIHLLIGRKQTQLVHLIPSALQPSDATCHLKLRGEGVGGVSWDALDIATLDTATLDIGALDTAE